MRHQETEIENVRCCRYPSVWVPLLGGVAANGMNGIAGICGLDWGKDIVCMKVLPRTGIRRLDVMG